MVDYLFGSISTFSYGFMDDCSINDLHLVYAYFATPFALTPYGCARSEMLREGPSVVCGIVPEGVLPEWDREAPFRVAADGGTCSVGHVGAAYFSATNTNRDKRRSLVSL